MGILIKRVAALLFAILASTKSSAIPLNNTLSLPMLNGTLPQGTFHDANCIPWDKHINQPIKADCDVLIQSIYNLPSAWVPRTFRRPPMQQPEDLLLPHTFQHQTCYVTIVFANACATETSSLREIALTAQVGSVQCLRPDRRGIYHHSGAKVTAGREDRLKIIVHGRLWSGNEIGVLQPSTSCPSGESSDSVVATT